jgi:ASC-1-like (ASCH) protein
MNLRNRWFDMVASGAKTVECRLNDEKRRCFSVGDEIYFTSERGGEILKTVIGDLVLAEDFAALIEKVGFERCGFESADNGLQLLSQFYSDEAQKEFGVVGIKVLVV